MSSKVLVVEDEKEIADLMALHLRRDGHEPVVTDNGEEALRLLEKEPYSLLVLDWMLPGVSGLDLCKKIRLESGAKSSVPVLMVTARAHPSDIVVGLEMGADDYLTKPFDLPVFLARVRALLRRASGQDDTDARVFEAGELTLDLDAYEVKCGKKDLQLTPSEFKLLAALVKNRGRVLTRERLIDLVQGEGVTVVDRAIDTHIFGLRKKLGKCSEVVETIRGVGYRIRH